MKKLNILIADDHPLVLKGLKTEFVSRGFSHVFEAQNGLEALQIIETNSIDIAILDVDMPFMSGMEVVKRIQNKDVKSIIVTHHKEEGYIIQAKLLGVHAYLLKEDAFSEIINAIASVDKHSFYLSSSFKRDKLDALDGVIHKLKTLSLAEREVIKRISEGFETAEVAELLSVSKRTIHTHRSNIIAKLELNSSRDPLSDYAVENKLLIKEIF